MGAQLGLPDALRRRGLTVEVVPGWETRSAGSFNPRGAVCHWTAGPARTLKRPSLSICTTGRADLPGPLCNVYLDRNGVAVVVAAGRANHAGAGTWRGATGNSSFFGTECEAAGPDDFTDAQRRAFPLVNAAFCDLGGFGADMVCGHSEYATPRGRKTDVNNYPMTAMRAQVAAILAGPRDRVPAPTSEEDDMPQQANAQIPATDKPVPFVFLAAGPDAPGGAGTERGRAWLTVVADRGGREGGNIRARCAIRNAAGWRPAFGTDWFASLPVGGAITIPLQKGDHTFQVSESDGPVGACVEYAKY